MQDNVLAIKREARRRVPELLAELLSEPRVTLQQLGGDRDTGVDLVAADQSGRRWMIEVKSSSRPGQVANAAEQLRTYAGEEIALLVVPFMSPAGEDGGPRATQLA